MIDFLSARLDTVIIEVTSKCNLRCAYCPKADPAYDALSFVNTDMSDDMLRDLYRYCKEHGVKNVTISGVGETAMFAGWHRPLAAFLDDPTINVYMVSNFIRLFTDDDLAALCKLHHLQVSFDSADIGMVKKLRSKGDLRTITYNIVRLRQKARELGAGPIIIVNCTICRANVGHIATLAGLCRELGVDRLNLSEMMTMTSFNPLETLDHLTSEEVDLFAREIAQAERILAGSETVLSIYEHLELRLGEILERARDGLDTPDSAAIFHRKFPSSACIQPWNSPFVRSDGKVLPCCINGADDTTIGDINEQSLDQILDGPRARAVRQSILDGQPIVPCSGCALARKENFSDFAKSVHRWFGDPDEVEKFDSVLSPISWENYSGMIENARLATAAEGFATLIEDTSFGYHRLMIDAPVASKDQTAIITFRAKPAGRRRLRLDVVDGTNQMIGRLDAFLGRRSPAISDYNMLDFSVTPNDNFWFECSAKVRLATPTMRIIIVLRGEDDAVHYRGDGKAGMTIADLRINDEVGRKLDHRPLPVMAG